MKSIFKRVLFFILPTLVLWLGIYVHFEWNVKYDAYRIFQESARFDASPDTFQYLVAGHSRLDRAIDTKLFSSAVKATSPGESFIETYYKLKHILTRTDKQFQVVLLPFEAGTFKPNDFRRSIYWVDYMDFYEVGWQKGELGTYLSVWAEAKFAPFLPYYKKKIRNLWNKKHSGLVVDKEHGRFDELLMEDQVAIIQEDLDLLRKVGMIDPTAKHYIQQTLRLTEAYGIQVIYIKMPLTENYQKALDELETKSGANHKELEEIVERFSHAHVLDLSLLFQGRDSLFSDHHHLNVKGREWFSQKIIKYFE